jgi:hypothetical protein
MKYILEVNETITQKRSGIRALIEDEGPKNNQYSGSFVTTVLSGPRLSMALKRIFFNHSSHKMYLPVLSFILIPGKLMPESLHENTSIVLSILMKNRTAMENETISVVWRDSGVILKEICVERRHS